MSAMALNLKRMAKAIFSAIYMDKMWAENMISQPIFYLCQQVQSLTLPVSLTRLNHLICYGFYYWGTFESNMSSECLAQSNRLFLIVCFLPYATLICIS